MPAQWTGEIAGAMHVGQISKKQLAAFMGVTPEYVSMVLGGHREPAGAEDRFRQAVRNMLAQRLVQDKHSG